MNFIDLLALLVALYLGAVGMRKGAVREVLEAASVLGGAVAALRLHRRYEEIASRFLPLPAGLLRPVLLFLTASALTGAGLAVASLASRALPRSGAAALLDEVGGFCFGAAKGVFLTLLALGLAAQIPAGFVADALEGSLAGRAVYTLLPEVYRYFQPLLEAGSPVPSERAGG